MAVRSPQAAGDVKHGHVIITVMVSVSVRRDPLSTVAQFLSSLDSKRLRKRLAAARGECSRHVH